MDAISSKSSSASVTHFEDFADFGPHSPEHHERRPPLYNAEDYVTALKKFCKLTGLQMYLGDADSSSLGPFGSSSISTPAPGGGNANNAFVNHQNRKNKKLAGGSKAEDARNYANPTMSQDPTEMGLRQFGTVSELLAKLKADLNLSFPSFLREFISEPNDGVTLLLDLLKAVQLSQTNITGSLNQLGSRANHVMFKRALSDEFEALLCLKICARSEDGALKLVDHPSGLFTIAVCVMSNYSRSRILSLQLLSRLCDMPAGHKQVSDAISMLRLRFGEPVRFKFLVGMLNSYNSSMFQVACLRFLNRFVETSRDARERIMIQTELEEAGFDILPLKKFLLQTTNTRSSDYLREELNRWSNNYVDVNNLVRKLLEAERANKKLREDLSQLKEKHRGCEDDRSRSQSTVDRLRDCCDKLQTEIDRRVKRGSRSSPPGDQLNERQSLSSSSITANGVSKSKKSSRHSSKTRSSDENFGMPFKSQTTIPSSSVQSQMHSQDIVVPTASVDGMEEADEEIDEVLLLLPTSNFDLDSQPTKERGKGPRYIHPSVNISDEAGSMVTVLATDGYTCITSPVPGPETQTLRSNQGSSNESQRPSQNAIGCSGDSGLSSDHSVKSASPEHHGSLKSSSSESDKSSLSEEGVTHDQLESEDDEDHLNEEIDVMYAERNVLQEEATTVESERISISRFRQRFCPSTNESTKSNKTNSSSDIKRSNHRSGSSVGSQFYPPNSTEKPSYQRHASNSLENRFNQRRHSEGIDSNEDPDEDIVPRRTSRPPMRSKSSVSAMQHRRPMSSPPQHKKYQQTIQTGFKTTTETDRKTDDTKREMIYLDDLTDGETSDGTHSLKEDEVEEDEEGEGETGGPAAVELHEDGPIQDFMSSNTNTLETMSARSFGFVKPSPIQRENEFANRLRRHKSFFTPSTNNREGPKLWMGPQNPMAIANRKGLLPRRSESFHHSRSLGEFDSNIMSGPRPFHPLDGAEGKNQLLRSADWDLRSSSPNNRSGFFSTNLGPKSVSQWGFGMQDSRHSPNGRSGGSDDGQQDYDWRQDTPFWNKKGRWARPSPTKKAVEEAWVSAQPSPTPPPLHIHPQNGGLGPIPAPPPLGTTNRVPMGWPGQFPHQGPLLGGHRKMGPFYPSFPVPGVNITHKNMFLPHGPVPFTSSYKSFVPAAQSSPAASFSGSSGSNKVKVNPLRNTLDMDLGPLSDGVNRLEITELSDEELLECPSPDYSTMHTGHVSSSTSPTHSVNTVIRKGGSGGMACDPQYPLHPHHLQHHQGSQSKKILDMPSGLY
ncbi:hypothetical protein TCAL_01540 [Tigriopus californicus]|uniref:GBD/FH3 domain-containing protein n=1 Tax=Tigriopus californicus TaxID=6832 RepID=A0A553P8K0_TIGCA|nr:hypothetical protein TCAL_01540 [Tigriopus californicus]